MEFITILREYWALFAGFTGILYWLYSLDGRSKSNEQKTNAISSSIEKEVSRLESKMEKDRASIEARIERERMESKEARLQSDKSIMELRTEIHAGFTQVNTTLEKVIFNLGQKADRNE